jgi:hypothetical protein
LLKKDNNDLLIKKYKNFFINNKFIKLSNHINNKNSDNFNNNEYKAFKRIYVDKLLNNLSINSSINNLFYKFYNVPNINDYNKIKNYLDDYIISISIYDIDSLYKKNNNNSLYNNNKLLLSKNYNDNYVINLPHFIKMYGIK